MLAEACGWPRERASLLHEAALVHDVGKIAVSDAILFTPRRLTEAEMAKVRVHAALGAEMLSDVLSTEQAGWVRGHHERWDGGGYPDGLAGDDVPEGARILHLADAWDVMTSHRAYVTPLSDAEAIEECRRQVDAQFWGPAVDALERLHRGGALQADALERGAATRLPSP
jgi:HD-GYP domain-containing protein (c-di-GMP phosphodiesterase class II)